MSKTILVTGGAGFIGSNFIHYWLQHHPEDKLINLDALTYAGNLESLKDFNNQANYSFVHGNILDKALVEKILSDVDLIVHFAAESHVDRSIINPEIFLDTNIKGTYTLLEAAIKFKIKHFHHISTDEVFGSLDLASELKFTEATAYDPRSPYSASKAASDHLVRAYGETYQLPYTLTNCSNNYGPYHFPEKYIPLAIANLLEGNKIPVYGDGLNIRDWLYVEDHCHAIDQVVTAGRFGETYLIGGLNKDVNNLDLANMIIRILQEKQTAVWQEQYPKFNLNEPAESYINFIKDRPGHDRRYSVDWTKINQKLGWQPSVSLEEGLARTIDWYLANRWWWQPLKEHNQQYFDQQYGKV